jgi:hypothetical protein
MSNHVPWALSHTQIAVEAVATLAFALSGVIEGARKRLDVVGICVVAGLAAFGGGTVRDILLDRRPLFGLLVFAAAQSCPEVRVGGTSGVVRVDEHAVMLSLDLLQSVAHGT